jgi:thiamine-monophosphate kinase
MAEFQIIEKYFKKLTEGSLAAQNLSDDVAKISLGADEELVISKDMMSENVHFLLSDGGFKIASKLLRSNLSDLASSGATPLYYMLGFGKSANIDEEFIAEFSRGLLDVQNQFRLYLIGGDTISAQNAFFSITIFGKVKKGDILSRNQAQDGDLIFVSGHIGDAHLGLESKLGKNVEFEDLEKEYFLKRHFFPNPRINLGRELLENNLSKAAIDVSDGLFADLKHLCSSSNLTAEIYLEKIPLKIKNLSQERKIELCSAGDDYELIFTVDVKNEKKILELSKMLKLKLTCIGTLKKAVKPDVTLLDENNQKIKLKKLGYEHL